MTGHDTQRASVSIRKRERAMFYLLEACDKLAEAHRTRNGRFSFTTLNEEAALSNLRLRLDEFERARRG